MSFFCDLLQADIFLQSYVPLIYGYSCYTFHEFCLFCNSDTCLWEIDRIIKDMVLRLNVLFDNHYDFVPFFPAFSSFTSLPYLFEFLANII